MRRWAPMDLVEELDRLIHRGGANNTTAAHHAIPLDVLLRHHHTNGTVAVEGRAHLGRSAAEAAVLALLYGVVVACALLGNTLVCHIIYKHRRLHTVTNLFIANLSVSDVLIALLNIPFNLARHLANEWPFGGFMCGLVNFVLMVGVYVSTFTMTAIALDRYQVVVYPLRPRTTLRLGAAVVVLTWAVGAVMALPFVIFARVEQVELLLLRRAARCRLAFPEPAARYEQGVTLATVLVQYVIPMTVIGVAYGRIARKLWLRPIVGQPNVTQHASQEKVKQKTVKMLMVIVVVFCLCWMPLNLYHLLTDLHPDTDRFGYNSTVYLVCHWLAMSSVCYNPFIYCWFNDYFRAQIASWFSCCYRRRPRVHPGLEVDGFLVRLDRVGPRKSPACSTTCGAAARHVCRPTALHRVGNAARAAPPSHRSDCGDSMGASRGEESQQNDNVLADQPAYAVGRDIKELFLCTQYSGLETGC